MAVTTKKQSWSVDSLVLIFSIVIVAQLLVYLIPQGQFQREPYPDDPGRTMVVPDTYAVATPDDRESMAPWYFLQAVPKGLAAAEDIIFLIFIAGGVIAILRSSGAIDAMLHRAVAKLGGSPWILIAGCLGLFSMGAYTIGMGEEYVPLIPIIVTMSLAMKMDAIVAMGMVWVPYGIGWACAGTNPFGLAIAQNIAGVPVTSGWALRLFMMVAFLLLAFQHIYRYAMRVKAAPETSLVAHIDYSKGFDVPEDIAMSGRRVGVLLVFGLGVIGFVFGAARFGWYIGELNAVFLGIGLLSAAIAGMSPGDTSRTFIRGASEMTAAALLVGFARTIEVVLADGQVIDTVIHAMPALSRTWGPSSRRSVCFLCKRSATFSYRRAAVRPS